jgi:hypothetical protein
MLSGPSRATTSLRQEYYIGRSHGAYPRLQLPVANGRLATSRPLHTPQMFPPMRFGAAWPPLEHLDRPYLSCP